MCVPDQVSMNDSVICIDQTGNVSTITTLCLLLVGVHVIVLAQKERVGDLHLPVRSQAWALVDQIVLILLCLYVDQTVRWGSSSTRLVGSNTSSPSPQCNYLWKLSWS